MPTNASRINALILTWRHMIERADAMGVQASLVSGLEHATTCVERAVAGDATINLYGAIGEAVCASERLVMGLTCDVGARAAFCKGLR